jgi:retron-type reverse transcriptase
MKKLLKNKKILSSTIIFNKKIAQSFHNTQYYENQNYVRLHMVKLDEIKKKMATPKQIEVSLLLDDYKEKAKTETIRVFRVLLNIRNKVVACIKNNKPLPKHNDLINLISNRYILLQAYRTIRKNKGTMTQAQPMPNKEFEKLDNNQKDLIIKLSELPDGMNWQTIDIISRLIKDGKYPWGCSRLIWIPKPGTKKERPLTIPPFSDRIVQEAIRMVLEAIYEPVFQSMNCSFGFRARNGVHQAISLIKDPRLSNGMKAAIEGDIEQAYPNMDRQILVDILGERILDKKFLKFMKTRLKIRLYDTKTDNYEDTFLGIPQGGIDSPYLWNIYLLGMDEFIKKDIKNYITSINQKILTKKGITLVNPPINPLYNKLSKKRLSIMKEISKKLESKPSKQNKENYFNLLKQKRIMAHMTRQVSYYDPHRRVLRINYVRYADDWIILTNAPPSINKKIKSMIAEWLLLKRKAILSQEKTKITDIRKEPARFLGFELSCTTTRRVKKVNNSLKRTAGWQITSAPDKVRLINRLHMKGYCTKKGFPKEIPWLSTLDSYTIIEKFRAVMNGQANFYAGFINYPSTLYRWLYIIRWSCLKTLACKYHTTIKKVRRRFKNDTVSIELNLKGKTYRKSIRLPKESDIIKNAVKINQSESIQKELLKIEKGNFIDYNNRKGTPRIMDSDFIEKINWVNFRTQANLGLPCLACGRPESEMHHIRHVRKTNFTDIAPEDSVLRMQYLRNRKQVPLCTYCHDKVHSGEYKGRRLIDKFSIVNYDNRIVASEIYIHKGEPYEGLPLEDSLLEKGWIITQKNLLQNN